MLLKKGAKLLLMGSGEGDEDSAGIATIEDVRIEVKTVRVYNLEVENLHTFFVGVDGVVVHNSRSGVKPDRYWRREYTKQTGLPWPMTACGENYHAHHVKTSADGCEDVFEDIVPMHPDDHWRHHADDRRRWGGRRKK